MKKWLGADQPALHKKQGFNFIEHNKSWLKSFSTLPVHNKLHLSVRCQHLQLNLHYAPPHESLFSNTTHL